MGRNVSLITESLTTGYYAPKDNWYEKFLINPVQAIDDLYSGRGTTIGLHLDIPEFLQQEFPDITGFEEPRRMLDNAILTLITKTRFQLIGQAKNLEDAVYSKRLCDAFTSVLWLNLPVTTQHIRENLVHYLNWLKPFRISPNRDPALECCRVLGLKEFYHKPSFELIFSDDVISFTTTEVRPDKVYFVLIGNRDDWEIDLTSLRAELSDILVKATNGYDSNPMLKTQPLSVKMIPLRPEREAVISALKQNGFVPICYLKPPHGMNLYLFENVLVFPKPDFKNVINQYLEKFYQGSSGNILKPLTK